MSKLRRSLGLWETFHDKEPRQLLEVEKNPWPRSWGRSGEALRVYYLSDKWHQDGKFTAYFHDHEGGVKLWEPWKAQPWLTQKQPRPVQGMPYSNGAVLGYCLGWVIRRCGDGEELQVEFKEGAVLLCAVPSGRALFAMAVKDEEVVALFAGGKLDVKSEGIVG